MASQRIGLLLDPLDTLFFRDGRPFGVGTRGTGGLPTPQTLAGALRTHLLAAEGADFEKLGSAIKGGATLRAAVEEAGAPGWVGAVSFRGPWLAREVDGALEVLLPPPASLHEVKSGARDAAVLVRLDPLKADLELPGWSPRPWTQRPLWSASIDPTEPLKAWLRPSGWRAFLRGETPERDACVPPSELYVREDRVGVGIDVEREAAKEGLLYSVSMIRLQRGVSFYAEMILPEGGSAHLDQQVTLHFGGEGRRVVARRLSAPYAWGEPSSDGGGQTVVLLTTPALFGVWDRPPALLGAPVASAIPGYQAVSGWDLARGGPKPNRFAAPAGSVFFMKGSTKWPEALCVDDADAQIGWGCYLKGAW